MGIYEARLVVTGHQLQWWQYVKCLGLLALGVLIVGGSFAETAIQLWLLGSLAHIVGDYNLQNDWMAGGKMRRELLPLVLHSVVAGSLPVLVVGAGPVWLAVSICIHFAVDYLGKDRVGGLLGDQGIHLLTVALYVV